MKSLLLASIIISSALFSHGSVVVSQTQLTGHADYGSGYGQSFTMSSTGLITQFRVSLLASLVAPGNSPFRINLFSFDPTAGTIVGSPLGTGFVAKNEITPFSMDLRASPNWVDITLEVPYLAQAGEKLAFITDHGASSFNLIGYAPSSPYAGGYIFYFDGSRSPLTGNDLTFEVIAVPELSSLSLALVGLLFCFRRSRDNAFASNTTKKD